MPSLFDQITNGLNADGVNAELGAVVTQVQQIGSLVSSLVDDRPSSVTDFVGRLAALSPISLPTGGSITSALTSASGALPSDFGSATGGVTAELGRFTNLVTTQLVPLLGGAVAVARAVEALTGADFRCPPQVTPGAPPPPPPPTPGTSVGGTRLTAAKERSDEVAALLSLMPSPLTPGSLLELLAQMLSGVVPAGISVPGLPFIDDVIGPVRTLATWSGMTQAELGADIEATLTLLRDRIATAAPERLSAVLAAVTALRTPLRVPQLNTFLTDYITHGTAMLAALEASDTVTATARAADLDATIQQFETLRTTMAADFTAVAPAVIRALTAVPNDMLDQLLHLIMQLEPLQPGALLAEVPRPVAAGSAEQQALLDALSPITDFLEDLAEKLDFSSLEGGIASVATEAQQIADAISTALADVAINVRAAFADVQSMITGLGLSALESDIRTAIGQAGDAMGNAILSAFAPLRTALATVIETIANAADALDFTAITNALADAVAQITAILQDPAVTSAVEEIQSALQEITDTISGLSFAPVTDEVIALIEQMQQGLQDLGNADLNETLLGLLDTAMQVLPADLRPVTQPLIDDFGIRIDQGPVVLLESVREKPQQVLDQIRSFDPGALVGEALGPAFADAKSKIEGFRPSTLILSLDQELDQQRARLKTEGAPSRALAPLSNAFDSLLSQLDRISPDAIIGPLEDSIEGAIRDAIDASPVDEIFAEINGVFVTIQGVLDAVTSIGTTMQTLSDLLTDLQDPDGQIDTWRDSILTRIDTVPNTAALDAALAGIRATIEATQLDLLLDQYDTTLAPIEGDLTGLATASRITSIVLLHQRLRPLVSGLPTGPSRTTIEAAVARFDPLNPAHTGGLKLASDLTSAITTTRAALIAMEPTFSDTVHGPGGGMTLLFDAASNTAGLRAVIAADVDTALVPVRYALSALGAAAVPVGGIAQAFTDIQDRLTTALSNILTGPTSLQTISNAIQSVVDTVRNIDLGFLRESLAGAFQTVKSKIESLGPKPMLLSLDQAFGDVIDTLSLETLLPASELETLDAAASDLIDKLLALDPAALVTDVVGPAFEQDIVPLVDALSITPIFDALIEALRGLDEELKSELERVNTAYQAMLAARPGGSGASAGVGI